MACPTLAKESQCKIPCNTGLNDDCGMMLCRLISVRVYCADILQLTDVSASKASHQTIPIH